jgi:D-threo-aldose 1-dehydrogenase
MGLWRSTRNTSSPTLPRRRSGGENPRIIFGTSALGNLYQALPWAEKLAIVQAWFEACPAPVVLDSAGKYGAGLALESIGRGLREAGVKPDQVLISNKLGWMRTPLTGPEPTFEPGVWKEIGYDARQRFSARGIVECWEQGNELLGGGYAARIVSCHDPDEFLAAAGDEAERARRLELILESYDALFDLKSKGYVDAVGIGSKEWRVIREVSRRRKLDWAMFACSFTVHTHEEELVAFMNELAAAGTVVVNSAVFNAGFLTGGRYYDYRVPDPVAEASLYRWRENFFTLCSEYGVPPAAACIEFGLRAGPVSWLALNTAKADRVAENVASLGYRAPGAFWERLRERGLVRLTP